MGAAASEGDASPGRRAGPARALRASATAGVALDPGLTDRAFARAAGSLPIEGNAVRLLQDAAENYPAWLAAIRGAEHSILFENYIVDDDDVGREFAEALAAKARAGVDVRVVYDWLGLASCTRAVAAARPRPVRTCSRSTGRGSTVRSAGCRAITARRSPSTDRSRSSRDCASARSGSAIRRDRWNPGATPASRSAGRRSPRSRMRSRRYGTRVAAIRCRRILPMRSDARAKAGDIRLRVVAGSPNATGTYRLDLVIASLARHSPVDLRRVFRRHERLRPGARGRRARRRRRAAAGAGRQRHSRAVADLARRLPGAARRGRARVRMERHDAAREDRRGRRLLGAHRLDQSQHRELDGKLRARRRHRGPRLRRADGGAVRKGSSPVPPRSCSRGATAWGRPKAAPVRRRVARAPAAPGAWPPAPSAWAARWGRRSPIGARSGAAESGLLAKVSACTIGFAVVAAFWPRVVAWPLALLGAWVGIAWLAKAYALRRQRRKHRPLVPSPSVEPGQTWRRRGLA